MEAAGDVVFRLDARGTVAFASARATRRLQLPQALPGLSFPSFATELDQSVVRNAIEDTIAAEDGEPVRVAARLRCDGKENWFELRLSALGAASGVPGVLVVGRDMSSQHATEERLRHMATHDALTELPNRLLLSDRIRMTVSQSRRSGLGFAVVTIGLDGFKKVNDGLGHPVGDAVLPGTHSQDQVQLVTGRLLATVQTPFEIDGHIIYVGASIGVAMYPEHAEDEVRLVALADAALSRAKETGKARCVVYDEHQNSPAEHDISLEAAMFQAVREGEFLLYYQPIVDAQSRRIQGFETLMRWKHPTLGMVPPVRFIPIAEANGLINLLGAWALKSACVQLTHFEAAAGRPLYISVNISPRQFRSDKFLDVLDDAIAFSGLGGEKLVLEITEGTLMIDPAHAETILGRMAERKARIAIDDFGTGYSSLAYLKRFPISVLKVDRAFIKDLPSSEKDGAICDAVLDLARHLDMLVVAEGVETEEQFNFLDARGCQYVQGYLTGKPMAANVAMAALSENFRELKAGLA